VPAREPVSFIGLVEEDVDKLHASSAVAGGEDLAVGGEVEGKELEVAIRRSNSLPLGTSHKRSVRSSEP
jgi:hypothetical protein